MKRVIIEINDTTASDLVELVKLCNRHHVNGGGFNSHGRLTVRCLLAMLAEDAGMVVSRPGSWEGSNMALVLSSHGYEV
ncbi:hypothetical protein QS306_00520 [Paraburkholderia bonniea]|uniref:hypothetical protein n=1 Tax=Paraburkholderia bonniea TaxID=2152891 RepID=UPI0025722956|nr:hypothetical protein [Paraburkholderia bonniea]WJF90211.1 hypothetical protein QS306_00520 [Paraburkholderia bonniea]WJF93525.1 hypothetical protein QS308_00520 [Paraburkholderia bonniea]